MSRGGFGKESVTHMIPKNLAHSDYFNFIAGMSGIFGIVLAIISLAAAYYFFVRGKRQKEPVYAVRSGALISPVQRDVIDSVLEEAAHEGQLEIFYNGQPVSDFASTRIAFWNQGREAMRHEDIAKHAPLVISAIDQTSILSAKIIASTDPENLFDVFRQGTKSVKIEFDFLNYGQGAIIQLLHTGDTFPNGLSFDGVIIGGEKLRWCNVLSTRPKHRRMIEDIATSIPLVGALILGELFAKLFGGVNSILGFFIAVLTAMILGYPWLYIVRSLRFENRMPLPMRRIYKKHMV